MIRSNDNVKGVFLGIEVLQSAIKIPQFMALSMFYSCLKWLILRGVLLSFSRLENLRGFSGLLKRMKQQKLTMGEVNK